MDCRTAGGFISPDPVVIIGPGPSFGIGKAGTSGVEEPCISTVR